MRCYCVWSDHDIRRWKCSKFVPCVVLNIRLTGEQEEEEEEEEEEQEPKEKKKKRKGKDHSKKKDRKKKHRRYSESESGSSGSEEERGGMVAGHISMPAVSSTLTYAH